MGLALRDVRNFARERAGRHLPLSSVRPVTFPSGRAKLPTRPTRSGSATATNTVGMVVLVRPLPQRSLASLRQPSHRRSDVRTLVRGHTIARGAVHPAQLDLNALAPVRHQRNHRHEHGNAGDRAILASCTIAWSWAPSWQAFCPLCWHKNALPCRRRAGNPIRSQTGECCIA